MNKRRKLAAITTIIIVAAFLRLYKLPSTVHFAGDEAQHLIEVRRMFEEGEFPLLGPDVSVSKFRVGPFFYYLIAIPYYLSGFKPLGGALFNVLMWLLMIGIVGWIGERFVAPYAGLAGAWLMAISLPSVHYGRWLWGPNAVPLFIALLWLVCLYLPEYGSVRMQNFRWAALITVFGMTLQVHPSTFLMTPIVMLWIGVRARPIKSIIPGIIVGLVLFSLLFLPVLLYELRTDWSNLGDMLKYAGRETTTTFALSTRLFDRVFSFAKFFSFCLLGFKNTVVGMIFIVIFLAPLFWRAIKDMQQHRFGTVNTWIAACFLIYFAGSLGFSRAFQFHYFLPLLPVLFILAGQSIAKLASFKKYGMWIVLVGLTVVTVSNIAAFSQYMADLVQGQKPYELGEPYSSMLQAAAYIRQDAGVRKFEILYHPKDFAFNRNAYIYLVEGLNASRIWDYTRYEQVRLYPTIYHVVMSSHENSFSTLNNYEVIEKKRWPGLVVVKTRRIQ